MSPTDALTRWRASQPPQTKPPRPWQTARPLTPEEVESLTGLSWSEKLTKARELAQTPPPDEPPAA